jgi:hypothetical protein
MLPDNIYEICEKLGLEKQDINNMSSCGMLNSDQPYTADIYKAGTRYGSVSINDF